jgi:DNA polymerase (family 10)
MRETVGDIDILATADAASDVMARFAGYAEVKEILSHGETRASVLLQSGIQVDLRVVPRESYGAALHYFTGSKAHNIAVRRLAQERGLKLNEYGLFRGAKRVAGETEESVFAAVGLPYIPPELREDSGEIEAARAGRLPRLVELSDLKGDLHCHSKWTDGHHSVEEMARAAKARGLSYLAVTDHSRRLTVARGLDPERLRKQIDEIGRTAVPGITLLKGIEVDILDDGTLDLPDAVLEELDIVIAAVHSRFDLSRERQTERILKALDHPRVAVLAHPLGRLIDVREPYDADMLKIIRKAAKRGTFLELNAHPERLDLFDTHCRMAKDEGAFVSINSDAHSVQQFDNLRYGVGQARRGWLEKGDVANTRTLPELRALMAARTPRSKAGAGR